MPRNPVRSAALGGVVVVALVAITLIAGPLDPPSGPVAPTYKTLTEVEPRIIVNAANTPGDADSLYRITQAGSYYLTGNIAGVSGKHGIEIAASNVTLDLGGFSVRGVTGSLDGVNVSALRGRGIAIRHGTLSNWGDCGLDTEYNGGHPPHVDLRDLRASLNASHGFRLHTSNVVIACTASENTGSGFDALGNTTFAQCVADGNGGTGLDSGTASVVNGCVASGNAGVGFALALESTLADSVARGNAIGITAQASVIRDCVVSDSDSHGASVFAACTIADSTFYRNGGNGVDLSGGTNIKDCTASENDGNGFSIGTTSSIQGCTARNNGGNGILATNAAIILQNQCYNNGQGLVAGAGIAVSGNDNRLEANNCVSQDIGIDVNASGNFILANTCSGNTLNWSVVASNKCYVVLGVNAGAISGDSGGSSPGSTNPWANFTY
jgi:hypothetical protein